MKRMIALAIFGFLITTASSRERTSKNTAEVSQALMRMEREWARAIIARDATKIREILAPEVVLTTPEGTVLTRDEDLAELAAGEFTAETFDAVDMNVRVYGHCAVVTGKTRVKGKYKGKEVDDQFRWTDTFVQTKGRWRIVASQATAIPNDEQQ